MDLPAPEIRKRVYGKATANRGQTSIPPNDGQNGVSPNGPTSFSYTL
jgi:hypothetical protein